MSEDHTQVGTRTFTEWAYDAADQLVTENRGGQVTTFGFDQAGNQELEVATAGGRTSYVWDSENRLRQLLLPTGARNTMEYRWDALRHRLHDSEGDKLQVWDPLGTSGYQDLLEENIAGTALRRYYRGLLLSTLQDLTIPALRWYHFDHLGTTQALTDATSAVTDRWVGNAWGAAVRKTGVSHNPQWHCGNYGYLASQQADLTYVRRRWLSPLSAQWLSGQLFGSPLSLDSAVGPHDYQENAPLQYVSPTGTRLRAANAVIARDDRFHPWRYRLTYRTTQPPTVHSQCGGASWIVRWELAPPPPTNEVLDGYIIQMVSVEGQVESCVGANPGFPPRCQYWEAWRVRRRPNEIGVHLTDDTFGWSGTPANQPSRGWWTITGVAQSG